MYLDKISSPSDVKDLDYNQIDILAKEIRSFLVENVSKTGGHLASSLGIVEITLAIHKVFDTSIDRLVFDVGHQCYVHKILTGRKDNFDTLRQYKGISGFPKPYESIHDAFIAGHASNSISVALGMARARTLQNQSYNTIALIGDGALSGGLAFEGLNDAGASKEPLVVIFNDNGMSINPNVGGLSRHLSAFRNTQKYYDFKRSYQSVLSRTEAGKQIYKVSHKVKKALKESILPDSSYFETLGFTYLGPIDGHNVKAMVDALNEAKKRNRPVLVHAITAKGKGYSFAEEHPAKFHGVSSFDPVTGEPLSKTKDSFSSVFGHCLVNLANTNSKICAVSAAMIDGTGLTEFQSSFPYRTFDVGIAEGHAVSMCAGLSKQGMIPVFAVYSTFLQRSYDMIFHDIALQQLHFVLAIDRSGVVGNDGETHHGTLDIAYLYSIPGMRQLCPSNYSELEAMTALAINELDGPVAIRYPRGQEQGFTLCTDIRKTYVELIHAHTYAIVSYGITINLAEEVTRKLQIDGIKVGLIKFNEISLDENTDLSVFKNYTHVIVLEDCLSMGCFGERLAAALLTRGIIIENLILHNLGRFQPQHGDIKHLYEDCQLTAESIISEIEESINGEH